MGVAARCGGGGGGEAKRSVPWDPVWGGMPNSVLGFCGSGLVKKSVVDFFGAGVPNRVSEPLEVVPKGSAEPNKVGSRGGASRLDEKGSAAWKAGLLDAGC